MVKSEFKKIKELLDNKESDIDKQCNMIKNRIEEISENLTSVNSDDRMAGGSDDHKIKIWNINTGKCIKSLNGHTFSVLS
ncbi:MAG: hypothetical protein ACK55I_39230, partial [bacterium]